VAALHLTRDLGDVTPYYELEVKQKLLWNTFVDHYNNLAVSMDPLFLHVDGKAGTDKTTVIESMCAEVDRLAAELSLPSPIFRAAPTGVAACNFGGTVLSETGFPSSVVAMEFAPHCKQGL
jgi:hypothetical protein